MGRASSGSAADRDRPARRGRRARCRPRPGATQRNQLEAECDNATGRVPRATAASTPPGGCGIADGTNRPWSVGDNVNLAVGQGDVQVDAAAARRRLLGARQRRHDRPPPPRPRHPGARRHRAAEDQPAAGAPHQHQPVRTWTRSAQGLREAASQPGGTSDDVFGNFPEQVYGKTGTAQYHQRLSRTTPGTPASCPRTATSKPIVVVVRVEQGGFGDVGAPPRWRARSSRSGSSASRASIVAGSSHDAMSATRDPARRGGRAAPGRGVVAAVRPAAAARRRSGWSPARWSRSAAPRQRRSRPAPVLRRAPGDLRRHRAASWRCCSARIDYSRLREYKFGLYGADGRAQPRRVRDARRSAARGAGSRCRSSSSSPRSSARCC